MEELNQEKFQKLNSTILNIFKKKNNINNLDLKKKLILEIGIGMGENLIYMSKKNTQTNIIGVDPFMNGMVNVSDYSINNNIKNIYLYPFVFQKFLNKFKKLRFNEIYVLFPDPWPKKRHQKRRLFDENFLRLISKKGNKNSKIFFKTDSYNYYEQVYNIIIKFKKRELIRDFYHNLNTKIKTKYHQKAIKNESKIYSLIIENN